MIPAMNKWLVKLGLKKAGEEARKTVTFGDPQAARGGLFWSILSAALIVAVWVIYGFYVEGLPAKEARTLIIFMPPLSEVWSHFISVLTDGYRNFTLLEHIGASVYRLLVGFALGCLAGCRLALRWDCRGCGTACFIRWWNLCGRFRRWL